MFTYPINHFSGRLEAFPQVQAVASSEESSDTTSHNVTIPSGAGSGDLLLLFIGLDATGTTTVSGFPAGWNKIHSSKDASANDLLFEIWYKILTAGESNFTYTSSDSQKSINHCMRIDTWHGTTPPEVGTSVEATSSAPNSGSLSPSWGFAKSLWITAFVSDPGTRTVTAFPTNYNDNQYQETGPSTGGCTMGLATRENETGTEDPPAFTLSTSDEWSAQTVAIRP